MEKELDFMPMELFLRKFIFHSLFISALKNAAFQFYFFLCYKS